jgi:hypothetical protein
LFLEASSLIIFSGLINKIAFIICNQRPEEVEIGAIYGGMFILKLQDLTGPNVKMLF